MQSLARPCSPPSIFTEQIAYGTYGNDYYQNAHPSPYHRGFSRQCGIGRLLFTSGVFGRHGSHIISGQCLFGCFHGSYDIGRFPRLQHINLRGSKDTSQSTGLLAESWISFNNEEPVFRTTNSIRFTSPAVISVLNNPLGVDNSIS